VNERDYEISKATRPDPNIAELGLENRGMRFPHFRKDSLFSRQLRTNQ
jgi:hypothetical protein